MTLALLLTAAVLAFGCATGSQQVWAKPGAGPEELARDRYACLQESRVPWGAAWGSFGVGQYGGGGGMGSGAGAVVGGTESLFIPLGAARGAQTDANRLFDACMQARGWQ